MPDTTPGLALPYPTPGGLDDVPADMKALAERLELAIPLGAVTSMTTAQRDALTAANRPTGRVIYNSTTGQYEGRSVTDWKPLAPPTRVDVFTSSGTYIKPAGAVAVDVICFSGGQGGSWSFPGAGGGRATARILASALPDTVPVVVGSGGNGSNNSNGAVGPTGSSSSFGTFVQANAPSGVSSGGIPLGGRPAGTMGSNFDNAPPAPEQGGNGSNSGPAFTSSAYGGGAGGSKSPTYAGGASGTLAGGAGAPLLTVAASAGQSRSGSGLAGSGGGGANGGNFPGGAGGVPAGGGGAGADPALGGPGGRGEIIVTTYF